MDRNELWLWAPLIAYLAAVFYLSSVPVIPGPPGAPGIDASMLHVPAYFLLAALFLRIFPAERGRAFLFAILFSTAYGLFIEAFQFLLPWRFFSLQDIALNLVGSCLVCVFIPARLRRLLMIPG